MGNSLCKSPSFSVSNFHLIFHFTQPNGPNSIRAEAHAAHTNIVVLVWVIVERTPRENSMYYVGPRHCWLNTSVCIFTFLLDKSRTVYARLQEARSVGQREIRNLSGGNVTYYLIARAKDTSEDQTLKVPRHHRLVTFNSFSTGYSFYSTSERFPYATCCDLFTALGNVAYVL